MKNDKYIKILISYKIANSLGPDFLELIVKNWKKNYMVSADAEECFLKDWKNGKISIPILVNKNLFK